GISFNTKFLNQANALVNVYLDGTVQVSTGATEMGQGVNTKIRQLVADEFGIDVEQVILMATSTEKNNNTSATAASSGADLNGSAVSEVEIDRVTGAMRVLRSDLLMDIGKSINPGIDRGQITGAFVQGLGWLTNEELRYAPDGELLSHSPTTYKIPNIQDLPPLFNVDWIDNDGNTLNLRS